MQMFINWFASGGFGVPRAHGGGTVRIAHVKGSKEGKERTIKFPKTDFCFMPSADFSFNDFDVIEWDNSLLPHYAEM